MVRLFSFLLFSGSICNGKTNPDTGILQRRRGVGCLGERGTAIVDNSYLEIFMWSSSKKAKEKVD